MDNPSKRITYDSKENIIVINARSNPSFNNIKETFDEVIKIGEEKNCRKVLLDGSKTQKLPSGFDLFTIGKYMTDKLSSLIKFDIAYVISEKISDDFSFFDNVATNRGAEIHTFKNIEDAKAWLTEKE